MYSNSRIEAFEQCPRKYKFRYVDNLRMDTEGIEAFVGKRVHEALEKLYKDLKYTKLNSLEDLLAFYETEWEKNWHSKVRIVRPGITAGHFFALGQECIKTYYQRYQPFNQSKTLGLEERVELQLTQGTKSYSVLGFIDRLAWIPETETYEIHDYKTGSTVPTQADADSDRQLALYQLGIRQRWPDAKHFRLVWHYLAADREIISTRTLDDLKSLEAEVIGVIQAIEAEQKAGRWDVRTSNLCEWCEYKPLCPAFKHETEMRVLPVNEYLQDSGVQLVTQYAELESQKKTLEGQIARLAEEQKRIEEAALDYAAKHDLLAIDGPDHRLVIKSEDEFKVPRKTEDPFAWELLRTTLKNAGKLEDVSTVNGNMLKYAMRKGRWPADLVKSLMGLITSGTRKSISLIKKS